jgi:hypothetical protein
MSTENNKRENGIELFLINEVVGDNLKDMIIDSAEIALDNFLEDGVLKEIPFFGLLYKGTKTIIGIKENIFAKKIYKFLIEIKDIPQSEREIFINKLEENDEFRQKVGEKLIVLIEQLDDLEKPTIIGKLFKANIEGNLSYYEFLKLSMVVQKSFLPDINKLRISHKFNISKEDSEQYVSLGIYSMKVVQDDTLARVTREQLSPSNISFKMKYEINYLGRKLIDFGLK